MRERHNLLEHEASSASSWTTADIDAQAARAEGDRQNARSCVDRASLSSRELPHSVRRALRANPDNLTDALGARPSPWWMCK
jgi:hypothetical protein